MQKKILIIEDEAAIREMIVYAMQREGFAVTAVENGRDAWAAVAESLPDLFLIDWMLPGTSGLELIRSLRRQVETRKLPIIMLTARSEEGDKIDGLDAGADDYITKPYSSRELLSRIKALLRRAEAFDDDDKVLQAGAICLDSASHEVTIGDKTASPGPTEYRLLHFLMQHPNRVYSRGQLLDYVWGEDVYIEERTVDVHVLRLRKLLKEFDAEDMLQTVRGAGYRFSVRKH